MNIALFLLFLPFLAFSQLPTANLHPPKRAFRIGLLSQFDLKLDNKYTYTVDGPLLRLWRTPSPNLTLDVQLFRKLPHLYFTAGIGYQQIDAAIDTTQIDERLKALSLGYREDVELNYWQLALGLKFELFGNSRFSPYIHPNLLIGLPSALQYQVYFLNPDGSDAASLGEVRGRPQTSTGYMVQSGIRTKVNKRLTLYEGLYVANLSFKNDWPEIPDRRIGEDFLRLDNGGWEFGLQYRL